MLNAFRRPLVARLFLLILAGGATASARAQTTAPLTGLDKQLSRIDFDVSGMGEFSTNVSGVNQFNKPLTQSPSNTLGALLTLRYIKSPLVGFEANYTYARYTQNYSAYIIGGAQANTHEYSLGYVAHGPKFFGVEPFAGVGIGTMEFKPTTYGGQGLKTQARAAYYFNAGAEDMIASHLGLRAQFRGLVYLAPDFGQNYLTITRRTLTTEPSVGVFLRF
jgi:hypothetical protein